METNLNKENPPELDSLNQELKSNNLPQYCTCCNSLISQDRVDAISSLGLDKICLNCAEANVKFKKAIFLGESGNSPMIFVDKVQNNEHYQLDDFSKNILEKELNNN